MHGLELCVVLDLVGPYHLITWCMGGTGVMAVIFCLVKYISFHGVISGVDLLISNYH